MRCGDESSVQISRTWIIMIHSCDDHIDPRIFRMGPLVLREVYHHLPIREWPWITLEVENCRITKIKIHWFFSHRPASKPVARKWPAIRGFGNFRTNFEWVINHFICFILIRHLNIPVKPGLKQFKRLVPASGVDISSRRCRDDLSIIIAEYTLSLVRCATIQEIRAVVCRDRTNPKWPIQVGNRYICLIVMWLCLNDDMISLS